MKQLLNILQRCSCTHIQIKADRTETLREFTGETMGIVCAVAHSHPCPTVSDPEPGIASEEAMCSG
jgi:hypothetical protein